MTGYDILVLAIKLFIALALAVFSVYVGILLLRAFVRFGHKEQLELSKNLTESNTAYGIVLFSLVVGLITIMEVPLRTISEGGEFGIGYVKRVLLGEIGILIGIAVSVLFIYFAFYIVDSLIDWRLHRHSIHAIKEGNTAIALLMAGVIIAVSILGRAFMIGVVSALGVV